MVSKQGGRGERSKTEAKLAGTDLGALYKLHLCGFLEDTYIYICTYRLWSKVIRRNTPVSENTKGVAHGPADPKP